MVVFPARWKDIYLVSIQKNLRIMIIIKIIMYLCAKNKIANNYGRYKITPGGR